MLRPSDELQTDNRSSASVQQSEPRSDVVVLIQVEPEPRHARIAVALIGVGEGIDCTKIVLWYSFSGIAVAPLVCSRRKCPVLSRSCIESPLTQSIALIGQ